MIEMVRNLMEGGFGRGWLPQHIGAIPLPQLMALFSEWAPGGKQELTADEIVALANAKRAESGLPPIQKRTARTFADAAREARSRANGNGTTHS